jgi:hypothetical protein
MAERREKSQMIGDFLREAAILWFALYPLEAYFNKNFDWFHFGFMLCIAGAFMYLGMILEGEEE